MKILQTVTLLLVFSFTANAQTLVQTQNTWSYFEPPMFEPFGTTRLFKFEGSEMIGGKEYLLLQRAFGNDPENWNPTGFKLRQEGNKVYSYGWQGEELFYDFDVELGDTLVSDNCLQIVDSIDYITLEDNIERKRIFMSGSEFTQVAHEVTWIEGIGNIDGLTSPINTCFVECCVRLLCFKENDVLLYPEDASECIISNTDEVLESSAFKIYPNPIVDYLYIDGANEWLVQKIEIYTLEGSLAISTRNKRQISMHSLNKGIYILKIETDKGSSFQKVIKN